MGVLGAFRTDSTDDIINVASIQTGHGYFTNAGSTLRQGVEAKLDWRQDRWNAYANYTFDLPERAAAVSPNNPAADVNGNISVTPGDHIPGIPAHRFKVGAEYAVTELWKVGADLNAVRSQYLIHDDANQNPKVPAYAVLNLHTSYQLTPNVELFGLVNNALNQHYYAQGTFFDIGNQPGSLGLTMRDHSRKESRLRPLAACEPSSDGRPRPRGRRLMRAIYFDLLFLTVSARRHAFTD
jgi:iron complex outermembrane recepter protein